jgi:hypothetical protein
MVNTNRLMNPQAITGIFGRMPLFKGSQLLTLQMKRDGPSLYIQIGTKETVEKNLCVGMNGTLCILKYLFGV